MILSKAQFFAVLFAVLILPFLVYKCIWILNSDEGSGTMRYAGKTYAGGIGGMHSVIRFFVGKDTVWFNSMDNFILKQDEVVPVRYQRNFPSDARINTFAGLWGDTLIFIIPLLLILLISFFHPDIVPTSSSLRLIIKKPFIQIV